MLGISIGGGVWKPSDGITSGIDLPPWQGPWFILVSRQRTRKGRAAECLYQSDRPRQSAAGLFRRRLFRNQRHPAPFDAGDSAAAKRRQDSGGFQWLSAPLQAHETEHHPAVDTRSRGCSQHLSANQRGIGCHRLVLGRVKEQWLIRLRVAPEAFTEGPITNAEYLHCRQRRTLFD